MKKISLFICLLFLVCLPVRSQEPSGKQTVRLSPEPKMRVMDRDWSYFKAVPCSKINATNFHSRSEEILLAKRKSQCMDKYKAFVSQPVRQ